MKIMNLLLVSFVILSISAVRALAVEHPELKPYPAAEEGQTRLVVALPHKERGEENAFMVEIVVGRTIETDGVNRVMLGNHLEAQTLKGWGYPFYTVGGKGEIASTLIGVPKGTPRVKKFVASKPLKIRYNSRLPIVVYAPKGYELRYRIWKTSEEYQNGEEG